MPADNVHGMRPDTLQLLKELNSPVYRWPGGNFVSGYDWKDGVGDRDRRPPPRGPSRAGRGILSPLYPWRYPDRVTRLAAWGQRQYPEVCAALRAETGVDPEYTVSGMLILDQEEQPEARAWARAHEVTLEIVEGSVASEYEPALARSESSAIRMAPEWARSR